MKIKLLDIFVGNRVRADYGTAELKELAKDFQESGQITPITVRPISDYDRGHPEYSGQAWALVAGGRRMAAGMMIGMKELEGYVREEMDELQHKILELHENLKRMDMSWEEQAHATREIVRLRQEANPETSLSEIARDLGTSHSTVSRRVQAAEYIENNPSLAKAGSIKAALRVGNMDKEFKGKMARMDEHTDFLKVLRLEERVVTADMRDWLRQRPDASANLTIVDYPYGMKYWTQGHKVKSSNRNGGSISEYDDSPEYTHDLMTDTIPQLVRTTRLTGWIALFGNFDSYLWMRELMQECCGVHYEYRTVDGDPGRRCAAYSKQSGPEDEWTKCKFMVPEPTPWVWFRPNSMNNPRYPELHAKNLYEFVLLVNRGNARFAKYGGNVLVHDAHYGNDRVHANQKPIEMYAEIIERTTDLGDIVVDPGYGSGMSLAAAASVSRGFYGCELNDKMRPSALALIAKYAKPIVVDTREAIERREQLKLIHKVSEVQLTDDSEIDLTVHLIDRELDNKYYYTEEIAKGVWQVRTEAQVVCTFMESKGESEDDAEGKALTLNTPAEEE